MSTFHGLEMAKRALSAQQAALYTTGHNISNAHTEGYSRQRVNFETDLPYPPASRNRPGIPGQLGTGVKIGSVERIRNEFLDIQFRSENSRAGYWASRTDTLSRLEGLLNEPSDSGLSKTMKQFWQSLQDLAVNPTNSGARSVVKERGIAVAETFQHLSRSIKSIQQDVKKEITDGNVKRANSLIKRISEINEQIERVEPHGYLPNDLYDERDMLIDELSGYVNIKIENHETGGNRLATASGTVSIELVNESGQSTGVYLIEKEGKFNNIAVKFKDPDENTMEYDAVTHVFVDGIDVLEYMGPNGSLKALIDAYGIDEEEDEASLPGMLKELDKMAYEFAREFNRIHRVGQTQSETNEYIDFFDGLDFKLGEGEEPEDENRFGAAGSIQVSDNIKNNPENINAKGTGNDGEGKHAFNLADVLDDKTVMDGDSVNGFFQSLIGQLGVDTEDALRMQGNTVVLREQVQEQRMSVSAVSLDEEMTNLIKFQHAYNAAARSMTSMDEMLDRIINGMGLVGR